MSLGVKGLSHSLTIMPLDNQTVAEKQVAATKASKVWFSYSHNCALASGANR